VTPSPKSPRPPRPPRAPRAVPADRITTDELRHKALAIRDVATYEAKHLMERNSVRIVVGSALVVAVALSAAYYFGSRAGAKAARARKR